MSLAGIRGSIVTSLQGISGLAVHDHVPDAVAEFPAAIVSLASANYTDLTFSFRLLLLADSWDAGEAELALHPYLEPSGASSVRAVTLRHDALCSARDRGCPRTD